MLPPDADAGWLAFLQDARRAAGQRVPLQLCGTLTRVTGLTLEAQGLQLPVGSQCLVEQQGAPPMPAEVVGFNGDRSFLMPAGHVQGLACAARVMPIAPGNRRPRLGQPPDLSDPFAPGAARLPIGDGLVGRVVDAHGMPLDKLGPLDRVSLQPLQRAPINAMDRAPVRQVLDTGVRAVNGLLTVGRGQRIGLFAGSGVGKSVLLGMMARFTGADVIVVGLIGERGREVREFIEDILEAQGRSRSVVVAAPADAPPLARMQGASYATAIAEDFRDRGQHVLLLMDSLTRYAMAQREIALAIGEPPATKGYPASCFAKLPQLVERSGNGMAGGGSITAIYTVLSEGDDQQDPVADSARAILDGHIVLSRTLAEAGHYPAIDVEQSASRVMHNVASREQVALARAFRGHLSRRTAAQALLQVGAYVAGSDPLLDKAIALQAGMDAFLQQDMHEASAYEDSVRALGESLEFP